MRRIAVTSIVFAILLLALPSAFAQAGGGAPSPPGESEQDDTEGSTGAEDAADDPADELDTAGEAADEASADEDAQAQDAAGSMQESKASQERTIPGGTLAVISYILLWLMAMAFIGVTARRQSQLAAELNTLEKRMDQVVGDFDDEV